MRLKKLLAAKRHMLVGACALIACSPSLHAQETWQLVMDNDPVTKKSVCLLESATRVIDDGQTQTPVKLIYNGKALYAQTRSRIDVTYPDVGLQVDHKELFSVDSVYKQKTAVFSRQVADIHEQFIVGLKARLYLGFWPTWPKTGTRKIEFSLIGYTRADKQYEKCVADGGVDKL